MHIRARCRAGGGLSAGGGGPSVVPRGWYNEGRFSACQGTSTVWRGNSLNRACKRHSWLVLNGRVPGDRTGAPTCRHKGVYTVLDYVLVPMSALADMRVLPGLRVEGNWHRAIYAELYVSAPPVADTPAAASDHVRPAAVALTTDELASLRELGWEQEAEAVEGIWGEAGLVDARATVGDQPGPSTRQPAQEYWVPSRAKSTFLC